MNGKIAGFCSILRFRWMYFSSCQRAWRLVCLGTFVISVVELFRGLMMAGSGSYGDIAYSLLVAAVSFFSLMKDALSLIPKSETKERLICFKDRADSDCCAALAIAVEQIGMAKSELEDGFERIVFPGRGDFVVVSSQVDGFLRRGGKVWFTVRRAQNTSMWRRINRRLEEASRLLSLKQKADRYVDFFNEDKVMLTSKVVVTGDQMFLTVAKTCYYASYLSNELYRDSIVDEDGVTWSNGLDGVWSPFDDEGADFALHELSGGISAHVGVNTIGVTKDGYVLIWQQGSGQHSCNQAAPTGSGSMDWKDLSAARPAQDDSGRLLFNDVIVYAAERELREESFAGSYVNGLSTRIIGYFRWGRRGGLPGFVCLTKIPLMRDDIEVRNREVCRNVHLEKLRLYGTRADMIASLDAYLQACDRELRMSIPLVVGLRCLRNLLKSGEDL